MWTFYFSASSETAIKIAIEDNSTDRAHFSFQHMGWHQHMHHPCWTHDENYTQKILQQNLNLWALMKDMKDSWRKNSRSTFICRNNNNVGRKLQQTFRKMLFVTITIISTEGLNQKSGLKDRTKVSSEWNFRHCRHEW